MPLSDNGGVFVGGNGTNANGTGLLAGTGTVSVNGGSGNVVVYNTGWDGGSLAKPGAGTLVLTAENAYTGFRRLGTGLHDAENTRRGLRLDIIPTGRYYMDAAAWR